MASTAAREHTSGGLPDPLPAPPQLREGGASHAGIGSGRGPGRGTGPTLHGLKMKLRRGGGGDSQDRAHSGSPPGAIPPARAPARPALAQASRLRVVPKPSEPTGETGRTGEAGRGQLGGVGGEGGGGGVASAPRPRQARRRPRPSRRPRTHLAESVLMEPVTSMSPARNSWYLVQAMAAAEGGATLQGPPRPPRSLETTAPDPVTLGSRALALPGRAARDSRRPRPLPAGPAP